MISQSLCLLIAISLILVLPKKLLSIKSSTLAQITNHHHFLSANSLFTQSWWHTWFSCRTGHLTAAFRALPGHTSMSSLCPGFSKTNLKFNDHRIIIKKIGMCFLLCSCFTILLEITHLHLFSLQNMNDDYLQNSVIIV